MVMRKRKRKSRIKELARLIKEYKNECSSVELQHKTKELWKYVSD